MVGLMDLNQQLYYNEIVVIFPRQDFTEGNFCSSGFFFCKVVHRLKYSLFRSDLIHAWYKDKCTIVIKRTQYACL